MSAGSDFPGTSSTYGDHWMISDDGFGAVVWSVWRNAETGNGQVADGLEEHIPEARVAVDAALRSAGLPGSAASPKSTRETFTGRR